MPSVDEVADSTDWLSTPLAGLTPLESSLRCQVCKDFFTTPMMTSCSHTFCSLCIRRYLSQEGRCPACREPDQELKLRRNWAVEEMVTHFTSSRDGLLQFARKATVENERRISRAERPSKRRKVDSDEVNGGERRSTRSQSRRKISQNEPVVMSSQESFTGSENGSVYGDSPPKPSKRDTRPSESGNDMVECPCCSRRVKSTYINSHIDSCLMGDSGKYVDNPSPPASIVQYPNAGQSNNHAKPPNRMERLPYINYSLLNDNALRKKLKELGIPNHGSKELMRKRHTEWVNLWNSNCDSRHPVSKYKLLQDLDVWERTLGRQADKGPTGFMIKEFDRDGHVKSHKSDFDDLIKQARQKRAAAVKVEETSEPEPNPYDDSSEDMFSSRQESSVAIESRTYSVPVERAGSDGLMDLSPSSRPVNEPSLSQQSMNNDIHV